MVLATRQCPGRSGIALSLRSVRRIRFPGGVAELSRSEADGPHARAVVDQHGRLPGDDCGAPHCVRGALPEDQRLADFGKLASLQQRRAALADRLQQVARTRDVAALGTSGQRAQWARVLRDQAMLAHDPDTPSYAKLRERLRLVRGVLLYQMDQGFAARLWSERKELRGFDVKLAQAQQ